jgi:hypothetical protein
VFINLSISLLLIDLPAVDWSIPSTAAVVDWSLCCRQQQKVLSGCCLLR